MPPRDKELQQGTGRGERDYTSRTQPKSVKEKGSFSKIKSIADSEIEFDSTEETESKTFYGSLSGIVGVPYYYRMR